MEYLLTTAAPGTEPSLNIELLTRLFEVNHNAHNLLCGSTLFDWARAELWGELATTRLQRDIKSSLADWQSNKSSNCELDVDAIVTEEEDEETETAASSLLGLSRIEPENSATARREFYRLRSGGIKATEKAPEMAFNQNPVFPRNENQQMYRQLSAQLHCLYGVSIDSVRKDTAASPRYTLRSETAPIHPYARSLAYDLRQHTIGTLWGPFLDDGSQRVDWEKIEAIMIILDYNMKLSSESRHRSEEMRDIQNKPFLGASPKSFVSPPTSIPMEPSLSLEAQDPYNITGTWMRVVCFLDYTELYDFNFNGDSIPNDQPRPPIDTEEAIRLITMKLCVKKIEPPGEDDGQDLPVVHFDGHSSSIRHSYDPNANSKTKGEMTPATLAVCMTIRTLEAFVTLELAMSYWY